MILIDIINQPWMLFLWALAVFGFIFQTWLSVLCLGENLRSRLSINLQLNIFCWFLYCFFVCIYQTYVFLTVIAVAQANYYILFYMAIGMAASGIPLSLSITFLMLERVLIISRSGLYNQNHSTFVFLTILVCGGAGLFVALNALIRELPLSSEITCITPFCIMQNGSGIMNNFAKIGIAGVNCIISIVFIVTLYLYLNTGRSKGASGQKLKKANVLVLFVVFSEMIFVIMPRCLEVICFWATWGVCKMAYMGAMVELNSVTTSLIYLFIIKPKPKTKIGSTGVVTTVNSNFKS